MHEEGLSHEEASERLAQYGPNEIQEIKSHPFFDFASKFWGPIPWILELILVLQLAVEKYHDGTITAFLLIFNAIISFTQENKAKTIITLLRQKLQIKARVLRDHVWQEIEANNVVPGDVIRLRMGDFAPADISIFSGSVLVDQSMLTGESVPIEQSAQGHILSGSIIKRGEATGVVTATGSRSFFGKTALLTSMAKTESYLEKVILQIVKFLIIFDALLCFVFVAYALIFNIPLPEIIPFSLAILIASVPVALPAAFTLMRALASQTLTDKGILVTKLTAIEEVAAMDILCSDKTGTLTQNRLTLARLVPMAPHTSEELIRYAALASSEANRDPLEMAIFSYMQSAGLTLKMGSPIEFIPFDAQTKLSEAAIEEHGTLTRIVKGSPTAIARLCQVDERYFERVNSLASEGGRVLSVAAGTDGAFELIGFLLFLDPPRQEAKEVIQKLHQLQVTVKMVTGDSIATALAVGRALDIGDRVCEREMIRSSKVYESDIFANVLPEDKLILVEQLQAGGALIGMTGDGVNDAPALRKANVGVAVANANDVAKASAGILLTKPGLTNLIDTINIGREVYRRMLTYTLNKIIKTTHISLFLVLGFFFFNVFITTPHLVMLLIFANDFITMSLASDHVRYQPKPGRWDIKFLLWTSLCIACAWLVFSFAMVYLAIDMLSLTLAATQTWVFLLLVYSGLATVFIVRTRLFFWQVRPGTLLIMSTIGDILFVSLLAYFGILMAPLPISLILFMLICVFLFMCVIDLVKRGLSR